MAKSGKSCPTMKPYIVHKKELQKSMTTGSTVSGPGVRWWCMRANSGHGETLSSTDEQVVSTRKDSSRIVITGLV